MNKVKYNHKKNIRKGNSDVGFIVRIFDSAIWKISLVCISFFLLLSVYRSFVNMGQRLSLLKRAEQEVSELRLENLNLSLQVRDAGDIDRLEKEARNRLNYGLEGEVVFVIDEELIEIGEEKVLAIIQPIDDREDVNVFEEWVDFILEGY